MGQIRSFFGKWFNKDVGKATNLLEALRDKGIFDRLPKTPMTMTLVAIVYESKEDLPSTLTELYEMFIELLTGKWDSTRKIASAFDSSIKVAFLARLAWTMQAERLETISQDRCVGLAREFFENEVTIAGVDAVAFIQNVIDRSHIVVPTGFDQLRFSHMTFQEYFCAEYLLPDFPEDATILEWYGDDWWQEVLFFLAGKRKNISKLVRVLLTADHTNPENRITKLITLGSMLQAGYLTADAEKNAGVQFAAEKFPACYGDLVAAVEESASEKVKRKLNRVLLLDVLQEMFSANFSSTYLKQALKKVSVALPQTREYEAARFLVACAIAKSGEYEPLLEFATDPHMVDTSMYLISRATIAGESLSKEERAGFDRLKKRLRVFEKAIDRELKSPFGRRQIKRVADAKKPSA